jgi:hypothetical protein
MEKKSCVLLLPVPLDVRDSCDEATMFLRKQKQYLNPTPQNNNNSKTYYLYVWTNDLCQFCDRIGDVIARLSLAVVSTREPIQYRRH